MKKTNRDIAQDSVIDSLKAPVHGYAKIAPRVGKSKIVISVIKRDKIKKVLWVTNSEKLRDVDIPQEFVTWRARTYLKGTKIICYQSLHNVEGYYDLIVLDEFQKITQKNLRNLFNGKLKYKNILAVTGTLPKGKDKLSLLNSLSLPSLHDIDIEDAVDLELVADYQINVVYCTLDTERKRFRVSVPSGTWLQTEHKSYRYLQDKFNKQPTGHNGNVRYKFIKNSPTKRETLKQLIETIGGRQLIFCADKEHARSLGGDDVYYSGISDSKLKEFMDGKLQRLFCVQSGSIGFTYRGVDNVIIYQSDKDKNGNTTQKITRALLKQGKEYKGNVWIICLKDTMDYHYVYMTLRDRDKSKIKFTTLKEVKEEYDNKS